MESRGRVMVPVLADADYGIQGPANPMPCTFSIVLLFGLFLTLFFLLFMHVLLSVLSPMERETRTLFYTLWALL